MCPPESFDIPSPFRVDTDKPVVGIPGKRQGYLMIASAREVFRYADIPDAVFSAARSWAVTVEELGAQRVYWIVLSEVTPHYHIHVFPRWPHDSGKGIPLFESRDSDPQPAWEEPASACLERWAREWDVHLIC
jgi:diadenosine tetraphosphate (Ap4A) HIT family hydrolase